MKAQTMNAVHRWNRHVLAAFSLSTTDQKSANGEKIGKIKTAHHQKKAITMTASARPYQSRSPTIENATTRKTMDRHIEKHPDNTIFS
jgi:hypothetical protein